MKRHEPPFSDADLPINADGRIYHLNLLPEELAPDILIVGDPDRVTLIAEEFFDRIDVDVTHRGLHSITGRAASSQQRVSLITSGMGTPSLEIVLNEIVILTEIDFATHRHKLSYPTLHIIRVGTSGGLQAAAELGTSIITRYAVGMDNTGLFYLASPTDEHCLKLQGQVMGLIEEIQGITPQIIPYVSKANDLVTRELLACAKSRAIPHREGITVSNSGFFANQGRDICRLKPTLPEIDLFLSELESNIEGLAFENMEMESSFLLLFMGALGHRAGTICPTLANRRSNTFAADPKSSIRQATQVALDALSNLRQADKSESDGR